MAASAKCDEVDVEFELKDVETQEVLDEGFREFERLDSLLSQVPKKAQFGIIKTCDLVLTCIDANTRHIALGTNVGLTFLFSRKYGSMQRLKATNSTDVITSIKLYDGIDDLVATGTASGDLTVFCLPGLVSVQKKQMQKFDIQDIHKHYITSLAWSTNGMRLFSGDKHGQVAVTDIDFYQGVSKSSCLLIEPATEICQLDFLQRVLLVSTRQRSFVVRLDQESQVVQIGTKARKVPGLFGACFIPGLSKPEDVKLLAARPGCRVWLADVSGTVRNTHIFGDPLSEEDVQEIPLLMSGKLQLQSDNFQLGQLLWLREDALVSWSASVLVVLNPESNRCVARQSRLSGIVDVAVVQESGEIFLLRRHGDARVIRISDKPEVKAKVERASIIAKPAPVSQQPSSCQAEQKEAKSSILSLPIFKKLNLPLLAPDTQESSHKNGPLQGPEDLPPVVELPSGNLDALHVFTDSGNNNSAPDRPSGEQNERFSSINPPEKVGDIVFSHRMKKHKKKKNKNGHPQVSEIDPDRISQHSNQSNQSMDQLKAETRTPNSCVEDESTIQALREADNMLNLVRDLISDDSKPKEEVLPETTNSYELGQIKTPESSVTEGKVDDVKLEVRTVTEANCGIPDDSIGLALSRSLCDEEHSKVVDEKQNVADDSQQNKSTENLIEKAISSLERDKVGENEVSKIDIEKVNQTSEVSERDSSVKKKRPSLPLACPSRVEPSPDVLPPNTSLSDSEVDQHMHNDPRNNKLSFSPADSSKILTPDATKAVDSAFARVSKAEQTIEEEKPEMEILPVAETKGQIFDFSESKSQKKISDPQPMQDIFCDVRAIEATNPFGNKEKKERKISGDDFYSLYLDTNSLSPDSEVNPFPSKLSPKMAPTSTGHSSKVEPQFLNTVDPDEQMVNHLANSWSEFSAPANIYSLAVSEHHVWFTDKSENIYYSSLRSNKGIVWRKATGYASQISVSPSGCIVWRLHKGVVHAGTKISTRHPEGLKWVEAVRDVEYISVFDNCAWFIKRSGELMLQQGLSKERPCYRSRQVDCGPYRLKQITCGGQGVVWAITEQLQLLVRSGVTQDLPAGEAWEVCARETAPYLFSHVAIDNNNVGWAIDITGQVWFCTGVLLETPKGDGRWWQVPLSGYIMQEEGTLDMIRSMARKFDPSKLSQIISAHRGGLVTAGTQGVWLAMDKLNVLQVCRGALQGYRWVEAQLTSSPQEALWKQVCANSSHVGWASVWAQDLEGDFYTFKTFDGEAQRVPFFKDLSCLAVAPSAVWTLSCEGEIQIRTGMGRDCPLGNGWTPLSLSQLGDAQFVHLSCNSSFVWAVELDGGVYHRIGVGAPAEENLSPVWLALETISDFSDIVFTKIFVGPLDWMVWAIDNRRLFYVRMGITDALPIGKEWIHVPGLQAVDMAITRSGVWALTTHGEIYFRHGISADRPVGDYWKQIPGAMTKITASGTDDLWGINRDGRLMQCQYNFLRRRQNSTELDTLQATPLAREMSISDDWELV